MENNPTKKITVKELQKYIISEAIKMLNAGDAMEVDMNTMDKEVGSDGKPGTALVKTKEKGGFETKSSAPAKAENIEKTEEPTEVKMNQNAKEGGSDEKIAAAVAVEAAGSTKSGPSTEGMKNAKFDSKDKNPSTEVSAPFDEKEGDVKMDKMDKLVDDGTKTFVEPGADMSKGLSTGQPKANWSEKAKNEKEKAESIAKAIQLPEGWKSKKDLLNFIKEESKKVSKTLIKEAEVPTAQPAPAGTQEPAGTQAPAAPTRLTSAEIATLQKIRGEIGQIVELPGVAGNSARKAAGYEAYKKIGEMLS